MYSSASIIYRSSTGRLRLRRQSLVRDLWRLSQTNRSRMAPSRKTIASGLKSMQNPLDFSLLSLSGIGSILAVIVKMIKMYSKA